MQAYSLSSLLLCVAAIGVSCGLLRWAALTEDPALRPFLVLVAVLVFGGTIGACFGDATSGVGYAFAALTTALFVAVVGIIIFVLAM